MAAALTYRSNGQQRRRRHLRVYVYVAAWRPSTAGCPGGVQQTMWAS